MTQSSETHGAEFELYGFWRTSATFRVRVALNLKGLSAREHFVNIDKGEQRSDSFLKINPLGGLPVLIQAGHPPLTQSLAILEYLDEVHPEPPLLPRDPHGRARVRGIAAMLAADTHPFITPRVRGYLAEHGGFNPDQFRQWQSHWLTTGLQAVEFRLTHEAGTGDFCHGDRPGLADICLVSITAVMQVFKINVPDIPTVERIVARCNAMEAFAKADPYKQEGAPAPT
jgi:maleylacetoacetate isomerase